MTSATPGSLRIISWWLLGICAFVAIDCFYVFHDGVDLLLKPFPTCRTELSVLEGIQAVARGQDLYPPFEGLPYVVRIYNPLTYLPAALIGLGRADDFEHLLVLSRILPFISMLALLVIVGVHLRLSSPTGQTWPTSLRWGLPILSVILICVFHSSTLTDFFRNRPEMPALSLSLAAWFVIQRRTSSLNPYLAGALAVAAIGFKQSYISAPVAIALQLLLSRQHRDLLRFVVTLVVLGGGMMLASYLLLGRGYFAHTFFAMASNPIMPLERSAFFYSILAIDHWGVLLPAAIVSVAWLVYKRQEQGLLLYLAVCLLWTSFSHGKLGADINYHGELSVLMVIAVVVGIARMTEEKPRMALVPIALLSIFLGYKAVRYGYGHNRVCFNRIAPTPNCERERPPFGEIAKYQRQFMKIKGDLLVLQDELAVRLGEVVTLDWYMVDLLLKSGFFEIDPLLDVVRERRKATIVLPRRLSNQWLVLLYRTAAARGYRVSYADGKIIVLRLTRAAPGAKGTPGT